MNANMAFARALVAELAASSVRRFVVCPGSRSGPVALAIAEAAQAERLGAPAVKMHVRIDERSAAFLALGIARATREPVAVVTTSGTAVGNLLPAAMEAAHSGVPLVLLTADRPFTARGTGANQTTDHRGVLQPFAKPVIDVPPPVAERDALRSADRIGCAVAHWRDAEPFGRSRPLHVNLQFAEPLEPDDAPWPKVDAHCATPAGPVSEGPIEVPAAEYGVVVAGDGAGARAARLAEARGWPLLAEPSSGARLGPNAVPRYAHALATDVGRDLASRAELVVVVGRPTLTRSVRDLVDGARRLVVHAHGGPAAGVPLHAERVTDVTGGELSATHGAVAPGWLEAWMALGEAQVARKEWGTEAVALAAWRAAAGGALVLGSSRIVRAADRALPATARRAAKVYANRGLAGIDGTVSTAVGIALSTSGPTVAAMGDLTFLHDVGGLLIGPLEQRPKLAIVVVHDGGGRIFEQLEQAAADPELFERVFVTPHGADFESIARGFGADFARAVDADDLEAALAAAGDGVTVVEAVLPGAG